MRIAEILSQNRRDFTATVECEGCGAQEKLTSGYDDRYFHDTVMPAMKCAGCGKSRQELGLTGDHVETRYPDGIQV
jgi:hypothetical protein